MRSALLLLVLAANSVPPIQLIVQPKIAQSPSDIHLKIFVPRHPNNRVLVFMVDGDHFYRGSQEQLDGERAPAVFDIWYKHAPCGNYVVVAKVYRNDGTEATARDTLRLLGMGCDEAPSLR